MKSIIQIKDLTYKFGKKILFDSLSLDIKEGDFISIIGSNNCGKTTLIKLIAGILPNNKSIVAGYSYVNNKKIQDNASFFGIVIHDFSNKFLFDKVFDELVFPLENLCYPKEKIESRVIEVANLFDISNLLDKNIIDITNSERQKLILALSYIHEPKVLLLDNPFIMMSKNDKEKMISVLEKINKEKNVTILLTSNDLEEVVKTDYIYVFNDGKLVIEGNPISVFREEKILNTLGLSLPFMIDLSFKLQFYNVLNSTITDIDGMVNTLWK